MPDLALNQLSYIPTHLYYNSALPDPASLCYARSYLPAQPVLEVSFTRSCLPVLYKILPPSPACVTDLFDQITAPCPACVTSLLYQILPSQQSKQNS